MSYQPFSTDSKFSLKHFQERRLATNETDRKVSQAPRKPEINSVITMLIVYGRDVMSPKATVSNTAFSQILAFYIHNKNKDDYIMPGSQWNYDQRFAVCYFKPDIPSLAPTKQEIMAVLANFSPRAYDLVQFGYKTNYNYAPRSTSPNKEVYLLYCKFLTKPFFEIFMQYKGRLRCPPTLSNMLSKLRVNLSQEIKEPPPDIIQAVINQSSCALPSLCTLFQECENAKLTTIKAMMRYVYTALPHTSSPGFPWSEMTKSDGTSWGSISSTNDPLMNAIFDTIERLLLFLNGVNKRQEDSLKRPPTRSEAFNNGAVLYNKLFSHLQTRNMTYDKVLFGLELTEEKVLSLAPHIIYTMSAGNVKPVTAEEIGEGKPNRSIFQSPAMIRIAYMGLSQLVSVQWKHPSKLNNFGWQKGGTEKLLDVIFSQIGITNSAYYEHFDYFKPRSEHRACSVSFPRAAFIAPDVKAQDNHFHASVLSILYKVLDRDFVSQMPKVYQPIMSAFLGFISEADKKPVIMTNNSIIFTPTHLNPSGGPFTSIHSFNHSSMIKEEAVNFKNWGFNVKISHVAVGDDALIMLWSKDPNIFFGFHGELDRVRQRKIKENIPVEKSNLESQQNCLKLEFGTKGSSGVAAFSSYIKKKYSIEFKPETLKVYSALTDVEFLGAHIYYLPEQHFGAEAFIASRPLTKILFSIMWGQSTTKLAGTSDNMTACMRLIAAYYDSILLFNDLYFMLINIYNRLRKKEIGKTMPDRKLFESNFLQLPLIEGSLPELPLVSDVFTWMTGLAATSSEEHPQLEGEEFLAYEEVFDDKPPLSTISYDFAEFEETVESLNSYSTSTTTTTSTTSTTLVTVTDSNFESGTPVAITNVRVGSTILYTMTPSGLRTTQSMTPDELFELHKQQVVDNFANVQLERL